MTTVIEAFVYPQAWPTHIERARCCWAFCAEARANGHWTTCYTDALVVQRHQTCNAMNAIILESTITCRVWSPARERAGDVCHL